MGTEEKHKMKKHFKEAKMDIKSKMKMMSCEKRVEMMRRKFTQMNAAKDCLTKALACDTTAPDQACHSDYTACVHDSGHVKMLGKHLYCYAKMKNDGDHDEHCKEEYESCLGGMAKKSKDGHDHGDDDDDDDHDEDEKHGDGEEGDDDHIDQDSAEKDTT